MHLNWYPLYARKIKKVLTTKEKRIHNIISTYGMLRRHISVELQFYTVILERACLEHAVMILLADN